MIKYLLICCLLFSGCDLWRSTTESTKNTKSVTKTTEMTTGTEGGQLVNLKKIIYSETVSEEVARAEQRMSSPVLNNAMSGLGSIMGVDIGSLLKVAGGVAAAGAAYKGNQAWRNNRDRPAPDDPRLDPNVKVIRKEDDAS